jgi:hypothetical protein
MRFALLLVLLSMSLAAQVDGQSGLTATRNQLGQVFFCQLVYNKPEVKTRLYGFNIEQCDQAE